MQISYALSTNKTIETDINNVDILALFDEPLISLWSRYDIGQLFIFDNKKVSLSVEYMDNDRFFLDWHNDGRLVVYDGSDCQDFFTTEMAGEPFYVPLACTVDKQTAIETIQFLVANHQKNPVLNWVKMDDVPFKKGWYDG